MLPIVVVAVGMLSFVSPSFGASSAGPPRWTGIEVKEVFSTRIVLELQLSDEFSATQWSAEYAAGAADCKPPERESGCAWVPLNHGEVSQETADGDLTENVLVGFLDTGESGTGSEDGHFLRGLKPDTSYYVRVMAVNADGEASETIPLTTLPVGKPSVDPVYYQDYAGQLSFNGSDFITDYTYGFRAKIDTEGALTEYVFEYAPAEAGGGRPGEANAAWKEFTSGARGTITEAEEYAKVEAGLAGLKPETIYYARLKASNVEGKITTGPVYEFFTTPTAKPSVHPDFRNVTAASAFVYAEVGFRGSETESRLEYTTEPESPDSWKTVPGSANTISRSEEEALGGYGSGRLADGARLTGLEASTVYYVRSFAKNTCSEGCGSVVSEVESFETSGAPKASTFLVHELMGESLHVLGAVNPESLLSSAEQAITIGGTPTGGTFSLTFEGQSTGATVIGDTTAGSPDVTNALALTGVPVTGEVVSGPGIPAGTKVVESHGAAEKAAEKTIVLSVPVETSGAGVTITSNLPYDASAELVRKALENLPDGGPEVLGEGPDGGPYTISFRSQSGGVSEPPIEGNGSGLTPSSAVTVLTTQQGGVGYDTHYHFQYVSQDGFEASGWASPEETAAVDLGSGNTSEQVSEALPALSPGETYHYRIVAGSTAPGTGPVVGGEQTLVVPAKPSASGGGGCPNEAFRTGLSAHLPDCRAYEQLTPPEKGGAQEPFNYKKSLVAAVLVGEDGDHVALEAPQVNYGSSSGSGQSPYFFSREEGVKGTGWLMTDGAPQPEMGIRSVYPQVYSADLTQIAFGSGYFPGPLSASPKVEYEIGSAGGPYTSVASVPRKDVEEATAEENGWVAADGNFSKLVLATRDHTLTGEESTGTKSGSDLYEYTTQGGLQQLNVKGSGEEAVTIGSCGARVAHGMENLAPTSGGGSMHQFSSAHTISVEGLRVFFEAAPGKDCSEPLDLYMRVNGAETVDIGAYEFLGANAEGTRLLLEPDSGGELLGYDTETKAVEHQTASEVASAAELKSLGIPVRTEPQGAATFAHPRYTFWGATGSEGDDVQAYRYDSVEHLLECISCASPFNPDPKQPAFLDGSQGIPLVNGGLPDYTAASANGEFAFFTTPAALVREDDDGETPIESANAGEYGQIGTTTSPSSDIYEWRAAGVHGCGAVEGCLALITDGRGGYLNLLLGTADEGRDVFFYTRSVLGSAGHGVEGSIGEGNIYDAREDGGEAPPPPRPVECEADACSSPPPAPNDQTPSSLTFTGEGNVLQPTPATSPAKPAGKKKKPKAKRKAGKGTKKRDRAGSRKRARSGSKARKGGER